MFLAVLFNRLFSKVIYENTRHLPVWVSIIQGSSLRDNTVPWNPSFYYSFLASRCPVVLFLRPGKSLGKNVCTITNRKFVTKQPCSVSIISKYINWHELASSYFSHRCNSHVMKTDFKHVYYSLTEHTIIWYILWITQYYSYIYMCFRANCLTSN